MSETHTTHYTFVPTWIKLRVNEELKAVEIISSLWWPNLSAVGSVYSLYWTLGSHVGVWQLKLRQLVFNRFILASVSPLTSTSSISGYFTDKLEEVEDKTSWFHVILLQHAWLPFIGLYVATLLTTLVLFSAIGAGGEGQRVNGKHAAEIFN